MSDIPEEAVRAGLRAALKPSGATTMEQVVQEILEAASTHMREWAAQDIACQRESLIEQWIKSGDDPPELSDFQQHILLGMEHAGTVAGTRHYKKADADE